MSISFTKTQLVLRFPEFSGEAEGRVSAMLEMARDFVSEDAMGDKALTALMLYTAHLLTTTAGVAGAAGPLVSTRVGDLSRTYAAPTGDSSDLKSSRYGQHYLKLVNNEFRGGGEFVQAAFADPDGLDGLPS